MKPFLSGNKVYLRQIEQEDLFGPYMDWFHDSEVTHHMLKGALPLSRKQQQDYFDQVINNSTNLILAIIHKEDNAHIGNVGLHNMDAIHRFAEMGVIIGNKDYWGKKLGEEAIRLICEHGFNQLNLNRIELGVIHSHKSAIRLYEKLGFRHEGVKRNHIFKHGNYVDVVLMAMLKGEML
ncbi:GNAT family N-acetyltransferase [Paenibacillus andongensis]|uniref:GNAT family N-acetyltransferase n=1 Tax=Paenibacillus andongensis TaxID=2975482 RepID=UPI0021BB2BDF|nr:GNAT family protein [Paenibacillus andongensis]